MRARPRSLLLVTASLALARLASAAEGELDVAASGGLPGLSVRVDAARGSIRFGKPGAPPTSVNMNTGGVAVAGRAELSSVPVGGGRSIAHVRVSLPGGGRWEALLGPGAEAPLFAGPTGYVRGAEGERTGERLDWIDRPDGSRTVVVSQIREDSRICGDESTPLYPRGLDAATMTLRGATLQRLSASARAGAKHLVLTPLAGLPPAPRARLLVPGGESTPQGAGARLVDGKPDTAWYEERPGVGQGEFVTLRAPAEVPIVRVALQIASTTPDKDAAAPRTLFLVTPGEIRELELPEGASKPGSSFEVRLEAPLRTECFSIVLGEAQGYASKTPRVGVAEIVAYADFEEAPLEDTARLLAGGGPRAQSAAAFLKRTGAPGLAALEHVYSTLDAGGRALAVEVATGAASCEEGAGLLLLALGDKDREASRKGRDRLERCGKGAAPALRRGMKSGDPGVRARSAELFGLLAPGEALGPLAEALGSGERAERSALRAAYGRAARRAEAETLSRLLAGTRTDAARLEMLRALGPRLPELGAPAEAALAALRASAQDMATRYLLAEPARELARGGKREPLEALLRDREGPVRARAAEMGTGVPGLEAALAQALADPEPRVREAALESLRGGVHFPELAVTERLAKDSWTYVRVAASHALAQASPTASAEQALSRALGDLSPLVKQAALAALGAHRATASAPAIAEISGDPSVPLDVRITATRALGAVCATGEVERLTRAANLALNPADEADLRIGLAAIDALGRIHPGDLARRLEKLRDKKVRAPLRGAADRALVETEICAARR